MTELAKIDDKILKNPHNYAAIYARISSKKDNNSIDAQISEAKKVLSNKNLLLYATYTDHVSGHTTPPPNRKGFGKLLEDAKAGCFKTIIAYKHDRIVRNLNDWINLKAQLRKLGIKIIFSDDTEYTSDNSLQGDFLENLIIMVAELEPNNINERTSNGKYQRRLQGIYNSAKNVPFGYERYERKNIETENSSKGKSIYTIQPLKAIFIQHLFCEAKDVLGKEDIKIEEIKRNLFRFIDELLSETSEETLFYNLITFANTTKLRLVKSLEKEVFLQAIIEVLNDYLKSKTLDDIKAEIKDIKNHLNNTSNITTLLKTSKYGGYMLLEPKVENKGIIVQDNTPKLIETSFKKIINLAPIIDKETFEKVYCYMVMPDVLKEDTPDFFLKGKLRCGKCNLLFNLSDGLLQCTKVGENPGCKAYAKNSVIEAVLDIIIDDAFNNSNDGFNRFSNTIEQKLIFLRKELENLRNKKMTLLKEYLIKKDKTYTEAILNNQDDINVMLHKISSYANKLSYVNKLQNIIEYYNDIVPENKKSASIISKIKSSIISYIVSNENIFNSVFDNLIKEVKVKTIERKDEIKCSFTVNYEFKYNKPSDIHTCIH